VAKPAAKVVMAALKDAAGSAVAVMAVAVAVAEAKVEAKGANHGRKVVLKGALMDVLKAVNHVKMVAEKVVAPSVANATRKARRARSAQPVTQHSARKVVARPANLVKAANNVNHASPVKVAATAVNVVVNAQSVAVSALTAIR
jgi:hypothetical protein